MQAFLRFLRMFCLFFGESAENFVASADKSFHSFRAEASVLDPGQVVKLLAHLLCERRLLSGPGFRSLFLWAWGPVSRNMFGPSRGFRNVFYPKKKGEMRMDILACPYCKWFGELGCFELTKIYCDNDERTYGHLPGLKFQRTQTLGKNGEKCDFLIRKE